MNEETEIRAETPIIDHVQVTDQIEQILENIYSVPKIVAAVPDEIVNKLPINTYPSVSKNGVTAILAPADNRLLSLFDVRKSEVMNRVREWALTYNNHLSFDDVRKIYANSSAFSSIPTTNIDTLNEVWRYYGDCVAEFRNVFRRPPTPTADIEVLVYDLFFEYGYEVYINLPAQNDLAYRAKTFTLTCAETPNKLEAYTELRRAGIAFIDTLNEVKLLRKFTDAVDKEITTLALADALAYEKQELHSKIYNAKFSINATLQSYAKSIKKLDEHLVASERLEKRIKQISDYMLSDHPYVDIQLVSYEGTKALVFIYPWSVIEHINPNTRAPMHSHKLLAPFAIVIPNILGTAPQYMFATRVEKYIKNGVDYGVAMDTYCRYYNAFDPTACRGRAVPHAYENVVDTFGNGVWVNENTITLHGQIQRICINSTDSLFREYVEQLSNFDEPLTVLSKLPLLRNYDNSDFIGAQASRYASIGLALRTKINAAAANKVMTINWATDQERVMDTYSLFTQWDKDILNFRESIIDMVIPKSIQQNAVDAKKVQEDDDFNASFIEGN